MEWNRCSYEAWETPNGWYYILEGSDTKGPFPTERSAMAQLQDQIDNVNRAKKHNPKLTSKEIAQELEKQGFLDLTADQIELRIQDRIAQKQLEAQGTPNGNKLKERTGDLEIRCLSLERQIDQLIELLKEKGVIHGTK